MANKSDSHGMKLLYITNIPAPYRNKRFNLMNVIFPTYGLQFEVDYMAEIEPNRKWKLDFADFKYTYKIFKGVHPAIGNMFAHFNPGFLFRLLKNDYQIAIVGGMGCPSHWFAPFFIPKKKLKILSVESNMDSTVHKKGVGFWLKKKLVKKYDAFQITGHRAKEYIQYIDEQAEGKKFIVLPNIIDEEIYVNQIEELRKNRAQLRAHFGVDTDTQMWICPARLESVKGLHLLFPLMKGIQHVKLFVAGEGILKDELQQMIDKDHLPISLEGYKQQEELITYYAAADLFVLPSLSDPSPLSPIEATAAKLPILVSDRIGNYEDVLSENGWGMDIKSERTNTREILEEIASISIQELAILGEASRQRFLEVFESSMCLHNFGKQLKEVYENFQKK